MQYCIHANPVMMCKTYDVRVVQREVVVSDCIAATDLHGSFCDMCVCMCLCVYGLNLTSVAWFVYVSHLIFWAKNQVVRMHFLTCSAARASPYASFLRVSSLTLLAVCIRSDLEVVALSYQHTSKTPSVGSTQKIRRDD